MPKQPIASKSLRLTRWAAFVTLVVALGSAAAVLLGVSDKHDMAVRVTRIASAAGLVVTGLLVVAAVVVADVASRARACSSALAASPDGELSGDIQPSGLWVRVAGQGHQPFVVVGAERENGTFLVARDDEQPQWVTRDRIESWSVGSRPA